MSGLRVLLWAQARRDAGQVLLWSAGIAVLYWSQAVSVDALYPTPEEFERAAESMEGNPAFLAMTGPARALDTVGGQVAWQSSALGAVLIGLMVMFLVGRHTRGAEESGRDELVRAAPVGRFVPVAAALVEALAACVLVGAAVAGSLAAYPLDPADSTALGLGLTLTGWCFASLMLVLVQLTTSVRAAYGLLGAVLAAAYALRAIGDVSVPGLSWLSPIGWYQAMHAFSGLRWWPALLPLATTALSLAVGCALLVRRDHGSGLIAERPGPTRAGRGLSTGIGLAWRLQRGTLVGWTAGMFVGGLAYGSIGDDVEDLIGDSQLGRDLVAQGGSDLVSAFQATSLLMLALIASGYTVSAALRPRSEEDAGRVDLLLSTSLGRTRWWDGHAVLALLGSAAVLGAAGLGLGLGYAGTTGRWHEAPELLVAELAYLAPAAVLGAWAWVWYGVAPALASLAWIGPALAILVGYLGEAMGLPGWLQALSPYEHLASVPQEDFRAVPVVVTAGVALLLGAAGRRGLAARDLR